MRGVHALSFSGRFSVMSPTASLRSYVICSYCIDWLLRLDRFQPGLVSRCRDRCLPHASLESDGASRFSVLGEALLQPGNEHAVHPPDPPPRTLGAYPLGLEGAAPLERRPPATEVGELDGRQIPADRDRSADDRVAEGPPLGVVRLEPLAHLRLI